MDLTISISSAQGEGIEMTGRMLATVFAKLGILLNPRRSRPTKRRF